MTRRVMQIPPAEYWNLQSFEGKVSTSFEKADARVGRDHEPPLMRRLWFYRVENRKQVAQAHLCIVLTRCSICLTCGCSWITSRSA
jgi:hypothetical protein